MSLKAIIVSLPRCPCHVQGRIQPKDVVRLRSKVTPPLLRAYLPLMQLGQMSGSFFALNVRIYKKPHPVLKAILQMEADVSLASSIASDTESSKEELPPGSLQRQRGRPLCQRGSVRLFSGPASCSASQAA